MGDRKWGTLEEHRKAHFLNSHRPVCILYPPLTPHRLVTVHVSANNPEKGRLSVVCTHGHIPRTSTYIVSKCTCSQVTGGLSGAHPPNHLSDGLVCMDGHRHADMSHLKDICISISSMVKCKKTISVAMVSHFSLSFSKQGQEPQIQWHENTSSCICSSPNHTAPQI